MDWKAFGLALRKAVASGALRVVKGRYMLPTPATADATAGDADNAADVAADGDSKSDSEAADSSNSGGGSDSDTAGEADSDAGDVDTMLQAAITAVRKVCVQGYRKGGGGLGEGLGEVGGGGGGAGRIVASAIHCAPHASCYN